MTPGEGGRRRAQAGQATVELALALPVVAVLLLAVVQVGLVVADQVLVVHAAREAARQAAVDPRPGVAARAAAASSGLKPGRLRTETSQYGGVPGMVTVRVEYRAPTEVPIVGPLLPDLPLRAKAAMRQESR